MSVLAAPEVDNRADRKGIWGWMLFDWAAQPFFTVVTTFIFGPYFVARLAENDTSRPGLVGLWRRSRRLHHRHPVAGARRDRRQDRPAQAVDRNLRSDQDPGIVRAVVGGARLKPACG